MLGGVADLVAGIDAIRQGLNVAVRVHQRLGALVLVDLVLEVGEVAGALAVEGDGCLELIAVNHQVGSVTDTGWVVVSVVVTREGAPFGAGIDDAVQHEAARAAHHVARRVLLDQVGRVLLAVLANEDAVEVLLELAALAALLERGETSSRHLGERGEALTGERWHGGLRLRKAGKLIDFPCYSRSRGSVVIHPADDCCFGGRERSGQQACFPVVIGAGPVLERAGRDWKPRETGSGRRGNL